MVFKGLYRTKDADPGYLIPKKEDSETLIKEVAKADEGEGGEDDRLRTTSTCPRCGYVRAHKRVSHCGRCNRCVDYMDHHCYFTDNCIGRANYRLYFHFILWAELSLVLGFLLMMANVYLRNCSTGHGAQGFIDMLYLTPMLVPSKVVAGYEWDEVFNVR